MRRTLPTMSTDQLKQSPEQTPVKQKQKYIPKMKCVVEGCKALSRGNGVGKNGEYCLRHGGRRYPRKCTYDGCNHYILRSKLCAKHYGRKNSRVLDYYLYLRYEMEERIQEY